MPQQNEDKLLYDDVMRVSRWFPDKMRMLKYVGRAKNRKVYRGQIYWCNFGGNVGSEQSLNRPALILQNDPYNLTSSNVIVAPITNTPKTLDTIYKIDSSSQCGVTGCVLLGNIVTVSKARLGDFIGKLDPTQEMPLVEDAIYSSLGVIGKIAKLRRRVQDLQEHSQRVKEQRNQAQNDLAAIREELGISIDADGQEILQAIQYLQNGN